jgi:hypothetical protein
MASVVPEVHITEDKPIAITLAAKLAEYDDQTLGLTNPEPGAKIVRHGSCYAFQAPGYSQSIYRWLTGESQETTKLYIEELATRLVGLIDEGETMLDKLAVKRRTEQVDRLTNTGRSARASTRNAVRGLHEIVGGGRITAARIAEIAEVLREVDTLVTRTKSAILHVQKLYGPTAPVPVPVPAPVPAPAESDAPAAPAETAETAEPESDGEPAPAVDVFDTWIGRVTAAHAALCTASASFRG